jgi:zinc protease
VRSVLQRSPGTNVVAFRIVFAAGSADDPAGKEGLTSLTADAMAAGGTASLTYPELIAKLYPMAASIDTYTDRDETVFSAEVATTSLSTFYPLLEEVLLAPRLDDDGFQRVRSQARSSLVDDLRGANDEALGKEALQAFLYEGHPYGHPPVGTEHGLASSAVADARAHRARVFCRERVTVGIAGDFPEAFAEIFAHDLAALPACTGERAPLPSPKKRPGIDVLVVNKPTADSTAISIGYPYDLTRSSPDFPAVAFFADYLGIHRQSSGRLYQELREKRGLNYGDYAYAEHFRQAGGSRVPLPNIARRQQYFSIWLRPVPSDDAIFALRGALYEYTSLLSHPIEAAEIARYRTFLDRYTTLEELTPSRRLGYAIDDVTYGLARPYLTTMHEAWGALDQAALAAAVGKHLHASDLSVVLVAKDGAALAESLVSGAPGHPPHYKSPKPVAVTDADVEILKFPLPVARENVRVVPASEVFRE